MKPIEKENFLALVDRITTIKDEIKEMNEEIKEAISKVAEEYSIEESVLKKAVAEYQKWQKDSQEYVVIEREVDQILSTVIEL